MKRFISMLLALLVMPGMFVACAAPAEQTTTPATTTPETTDPGPTEPAEEAKVLKVLTLGHSLAVDAGHMLALVAHAEGYKEMKVATLYYSGCPLNQHVKFATENAPEYKLYVSSTTEPYKAPTIMDAVTMEYALRLDYWDIIVMQGGVFEIAKDNTYTDGNIQWLQKYVNEQKLNPLAIFAWNMAWAPPTSNALRDTYPYENNGYYSGYLPYNDDRTTLYKAITKCVSDNILTDDTFQFMIPSGTVMENALSSYLEEADLHRDYVHATDLARVMVSYAWFCRLTGVEKLDEIKLDTVPVALFRSNTGTEDWVLTEEEKALILESVNNALADPLNMTPSQYTAAP